MLPFDPSPAQLSALTRLNDLGAVRQVTLLKRHNDVWRVEADAGTFYLKAYTKVWYGDDLAATAGCVQHELAAYHSLEQRGLPVPQQRWGDTTGKVLGRPALLLSSLPGWPLTTALSRFPGDATELLRQVGQYLARMHALTFQFPGYLMNPAGPQGAPDAADWTHPLWTVEAAQAEAHRQLNNLDLPVTLHEELTRRFAELTALLAAAYHPPRFTHGDCHASQFFVARSAHGWRVSGVLDLEVASAGAAEADFVKLALELRGAAPSLEWWTPLFEGYGQIPDFERLRLWLLVAGDESWQAHGPLDYSAALSRVLTARDWPGLLKTPPI
ncbi:aminoglycoside phosphotransferase family protein [Deinococcus alpinitundrae]|uniref:aminoglycoside phosphotransferase family protein n=1 Tax=Deinococcus alpinitundrae TaxID=468913 RepID=UPI00137A17F4|nr:aminoglycoside phosphotransferase family protein [Deinococcus alpinitundrae]